MPDRGQLEERLERSGQWAKAVLAAAQELYSPREWTRLGQEQRGEECSSADLMLRAALPFLVAALSRVPAEGGDSPKITFGNLSDVHGPDPGPADGEHQLTPEEADAICDPEPWAVKNHLRGSGLRKLRRLARGE